jgi:hypothetical protein
MYKENIKERNHPLLNPKPLRVYFVFTILALIAYFPLWSFLMALKNDSLTLSYPLFHFFSDQLRTGSVPWWHYNVHLGFPLHADPGFPFWSPITWLFALAGSSLYVFSFLLLFYILIAGYSTICLIKGLGLSPVAQISGAILYVLSGFFISHLEHLHYIFEAAFIPSCLHYFLKICDKPRLKNGVQLGISLFFLINSGYPSFTISAVYFFTIMLALNLVFNKRYRQTIHLRAVFLYLATGISLAFILCLPYLCSVMELYPRFNRGGALSEVNTLTGGFTLKSLLSLLFPLASVLHPDFFKTDISWNNIFFGSIVLCLSIYGLLKVRHSAKLPLFFSGCLLLLLSFQGLIKIFFFRYIPLFDHIHTNGGLRIYFILCMIAVAMMALDRILQTADVRPMRNIFFVMLLVYTAAALWSYFTGGFPDFSLPLISLLKTLTIKQAILLQSLISLLIMLIALSVYRKLNWLWLVIYAEILCAFVINLPYTGLSINRTTVVQHHLDSITSITTSRQSNILPSYPGEDKFFRDTALFSPPISLLQADSYPSGLASYFHFVSTRGNETLKNMKTVTCIHASGTGGDHMHLSAIMPKSDAISIKGNVDVNDTLIIAQNNYPNWSYHSSTQSGKPMTVSGTFMAIPVKKGIVDVKLSYWPSVTLYCFVLSIFAWIFSCIILMTKK